MLCEIRCYLKKAVNRGFCNTAALSAENERKMRDLTRFIPIFLALIYYEFSVENFQGIQEKYNYNFL